MRLEDKLDGMSAKALKDFSTKEWAKAGVAAGAPALFAPVALLGIEWSNQYSLFLNPYVVNYALLAGCSAYAGRKAYTASRAAQKAREKGGTISSLDDTLQKMSPQDLKSYRTGEWVKAGVAGTVGAGAVGYAGLIAGTVAGIGVAKLLGIGELAVLIPMGLGATSGGLLGLGAAWAYAGKKAYNAIQVGHRLSAPQENKG